MRVRRIAFLALLLATILSVNPLAAAGLSLGTIIWSSYLHWYPIIPTRVLRQGIGFLPYIAPIAAWCHLPQIIPTAAGLLLSVAASGALLLAQRSSIRIALDPELCALLPPLTTEQKAGNVLHYLLPAVGQELLHRGFVLGTISALTGNIWIGVAVSTATFLLEHVVCPKEARLDLDLKHISQWTALSVFNGVVVATGNGLAAAMIVHIVLNMPMALQQVLRPNRTRVS